MRRAAAIALAVLLALPTGGAGAPNSSGTISGVVRLAGSPKSGVTVAFIELMSGALVRATSAEDGRFQVEAPPGEYTVTIESQVGLAIKEAPVRVAVVDGKAATADLELAAVASALLEPPPPTPASQPPATTLPPDQSAAAQAPTGLAETTGSGAQIQFKPVTCFVEGEFPLLSAQIEPVASVARARIYFKGNTGASFYYVEMAQEAGRYSGKLPRPYVAASPITYYIQSTTTEFDESQTREIEAVVVKNKDDCGDREIAAIGPPGPVTVFSGATGAVGSPTGFAAAAASSILVGVITAVAVGAAAAGVVGGVVVAPGPVGPTPPSVIVNPSPIPTPEPLPIPTPTPLTTFR